MGDRRAPAVAVTVGYGPAKTPTQVRPLPNVRQLAAHARTRAAQLDQDVQRRQEPDREPVRMRKLREPFPDDRPGLTRQAVAHGRAMTGSAMIDILFIKLRTTDVEAAFLSCGR